MTVDHEQLRERAEGLLEQAHRAVSLLLQAARIDPVLVEAVRKVDRYLHDVEATNDELRAERDALRERLAEVNELHRKSAYPASRGEHKGRHYCPSCTTSIDFFTAYVDWPCATARAALSPQEGT
jgi:hypothetical protein